MGIYVVLSFMTPISSVCVLHTAALLFCLFPTLLCVYPFIFLSLFRSSRRAEY